MNAIMGMTHLVQKTELNPKQRDYLQKIEGASQHLLGIINDILDISKIEAGKMAIEQVAFSLDSLLARVTDLVGDKARDKGLNLEVTIDPDVPRQLRGDVLRLSQILVNYANNAVKFTHAGLVHIRVAVHGDTEQSLPSEVGQLPSPSGLPSHLTGSPITLKFSVRDTGIGLSQEAMDYLFQSFVQADASTTRRYGGTGLGLAISKQLARLMHGDVGVHSSPGQGATFWFTAQLLVADLRELAHGGQTVNPTLEGPNMAGPRTGLRVLLAEDNPINQQVAQEMLEALGAVVTVVGDGAQALETLSQPHAFDLVLMDMQMPVMDGLEATRRLRALPGLCTLPVLAMTANAMQSAIDQCLQAGMNDHLAKPVNPEALSRALTRWTGAGVGVEVGADDEHEGTVHDARNQSADQMLQAAHATDVQRALEQLTRVEGLDTAQGLRSVLRPALYIELLRQFSRAERDFGQRCAQALGVGVDHVDGAQALRLAHTLKGVAATLGAHHVAAQAAQLETLLHTLATNHPEVQAAAQSLQSTLGSLRLAVDEVLSHSSEEPHTKTPAAPTTDVRDIVRRMAALARESDATALELMQEHRVNLEKNWPQATRHAAELLQNYDFPEAALVLEAALTGSA
jgi:CheY-like chemotaxis protein